MNNPRPSGTDAQCSKRFADKAVVVTGGGTGIGLQIVMDLQHEGATVHILGRRKDRLEMARGMVSADGSRFFCHQCDVSDYENVQDVFRRIK
jgi:NAD(P)-dependent dehydrogenase (short-subunit alcohol dehydrogenase family)